MLAEADDVEVPWASCWRLLWQPLRRVQIPAGP